MNWKAIEGRVNNLDCMIEIGRSRYTIRAVAKRGVYVIRRNGKELGRASKLSEAKERAETYEAAMPGDHKLEGKAYAVRAIKLAMAKIEVHDEQHGNTPPLDESYEYLQAAIDVLEGRVPHYATLPEVE